MSYNQVPLMLIFQKNQQRQQYTGPSRQGHSFTYSSSLNASLLFGGCRDPDLYLFDHSKKTWSCKSTSVSKKQPKATKYHAAAILEMVGGLVVSGGRNDHGHSLDDIYLLSMKDWRWRKVLMDKLPEPRQKHALIPLSKSELLLFGGVSMPYNQATNDVWILRAQDSKLESKTQIETISSSLFQSKGQTPQGICYGEATVLIGDRMFCGCERKGRPGQMDLYCLELRGRIWKKLDLKFLAGQMRFYKVIAAGRDEGVVLWTGQGGASPSEGKCYLFNHSMGAVTPIQLGWSLPQADSATDAGNLSQLICLTRGKRLFTGTYTIQPTQSTPQMQPPQGSIEDYLIAIKHEQLLSAQLSKKNTLLEQLYKQMQSYITTLNREYIQYDEMDGEVERQKEKHIEDCKVLKVEYQRLNGAQDKVVGCIRQLRNELSAINEQFERCIQTEFDEQAQ